MVQAFGPNSGLGEPTAADHPTADPDQTCQARDLVSDISELAGLIVWTADRVGRLSTISRSSIASVEDTADIEGWPCHPDDRSLLARMWKSNGSKELSGPAEIRLRTIDRTYRYFRIRAQARRDPRGEAIGWFGFLEDIHEQRMAEDLHRETEERYRLAFEATNDALYDLDIPNRQISWRATGRAFFDYPPQTEPTSLSWWEERIHPDDRNWIVRGFDQTMASDRMGWVVEYRFRKADGSYVHLHDQGLILRDEDGRALRAVGAMSDVTQQRRAEVEIERMEVELMHLSRRHAMGTMAATLAHELNQPLAAASNFVGAAQRLATQAAPALPGGLREALDEAQASTRRLGEIVRRLRQLVADGTTNGRAENLPKLLKEGARLALSDAEIEGVETRFELDPEAEWVWVDPIQIQQVMINLVRNAVEAMADSTERQILIRTRKAGDSHAEISIEDKGIGIDPTKADSLFSQFVTTKSGGLGIGLPISRTIIEAHGGRLWALPPRKSGATFCFTLPLTTRRAKSPPAL